MNLCINCKYCVRITSIKKDHGTIPVDNMECHHQEVQYPIDGEKYNCDIARFDERLCGCKGRYFEHKE